VGTELAMVLIHILCGTLSVFRKTIAFFLEIIVRR